MLAEPLFMLDKLTLSHNQPGAMKMSHVSLGFHALVNSSLNLSNTKIPLT
uniref:Uncharacterized protein n=1 Tax=Anguilla anguilla TaxID=7936 RepID=A0A0E9SCU8_ANGAN